MKSQYSNLITQTKPLIPKSLDEKSSVSVNELMGALPGPDLTGGIVMGKSGIRKAYQTGKGKVCSQSRRNHFMA